MAEKSEEKKVKLYQKDQSYFICTAHASNHHPCNPNKSYKI